MRTGCFIVIDGIAGCGKSTIADAASAWAERRGQRVFRLRDHDKAHGAPPRFEDLDDPDVLFTYEPTRSWIGAAIRAELSREDEPHGSVEIAHAFALDRQVHYRRVVLPALQAGKIVIQERSVSSSIVYQPIMDGGLSLEDILELPGNAQAMRHPPDHLILARIPPERSVARLAQRDNRLQGFSAGATGVFLQLPYLKRVDERFRSDWYRALWEQAGTRVHELDTDRPIEAVRLDAECLLESLLPA